MQNIYVLDSNVFLSLHNISEVEIRLPDRVWENMAKMMQAGTLISHRHVYNEIVYTSKKSKGKFQPRPPDALVKWMQPKKRFFLNRTGFQINKTQSIVHNFPKLIDPEKEKEDADPWIIALALEKNSNPDTKQVNLLEGVVPGYQGIVVTQENPRSPERMPAACKAFGVRCITSKEFFEENSISLM